MCSAGRGNAPDLHSGGHHDTAGGAHHPFTSQRYGLRVTLSNGWTETDAQVD